MKRRSSSVFSIFFVIAIAFAGIASAVLLLFFGDADVVSTPNELSVNTISGEYCLIAQYNSQYNYNFVVEQKIGDSYIYLCDKSTTSNTINLSDFQNLLLKSGGEYRFKVAYSSENNRLGEYSTYCEWIYKAYLPKAQVQYSEGVLSWELEDADSFEVMLIGPDSSVTDYTAEELTENEIDLTECDVGSYKVFITASSANYLSSITEYTFTIE